MAIVTSVIRGGRVLLADGVIRDLDAVLSAGRITDLAPPGATQSTELIEATGCTVVPGFIDVHVHGGGGHSLLAGDAEQVRRYARWVVRHGVTSFLMGAIGPTPAQMLDAIAAGREAIARPLPGSAEILGFHFEGPFLNPSRHGAFAPAWLRRPSVPELDRYLDAAGPLARLMTIAPELARAEAVVRRAVARGMAMSMGHTDATLAEARAGFAWGITHVTHCFNAMRPFSHRDPGAVGAALTTPGITCELIGDGVHVDPTAMNVLLRCKGAIDTVLVTDGLALAGAGDGSHRLGGRSVSVRGGAARLEDGTIAGSITTMDANLRTVLALGASLPDAVHMASGNPARAAGVAHRKGGIAVGMDADLVLLDKAQRVVKTIVGGQVVFERDRECGAGAHR